MSSTPALRVSTSGIRPGSNGVGCVEEEGSEADDEDLVTQRRFGPIRSREASLVKETARCVDFVSIRKAGVLIFVGNLPFKISIRWLLMTFRRFGNVIDVFIPDKLSRGFWRKYEFVRFGSDREVEHAIRGMDGALIGKWNLIVQRAKYNFVSSVPNRKTRSVSSPRNSLSSKGLSENLSPGVIRQDVGHVSYSKNPMASKGVLGNLSRGVLSQVDGKFGSKMLMSTFVSQDEDNLSHGAISHAGGMPGAKKRILGVSMVSDWDLCAALAILHEGKLFFDMRSVIMESCSFVRSISLIKDNLVLILFQSPYHRGLAIDHGLWTHWFFSVKPWSEGKVVGENRIWVECRGISFCAWNEITFEAIARVWGSIVEMDPVTSDMVHLSYARFCISTNVCAINEIIELQVGDNIFDISVSCSRVQNNSTTNKMASSLSGSQLNIPLSRSVLWEHELISLQRNSSKRDYSHCKPFSFDKVKVKSDNRLIQGNPSISAERYAADSTLKVHFVKENLVQADNELRYHVSPSNALRGMSNFSENSCMHESLKPDDDIMVVPNCGGVNVEPVHAVSAIQTELNDAGYVVNDLSSCGTKREEADQVNQQYVIMMNVSDSQVEDAGHIQCPNTESIGVVNGFSEGITSDSVALAEVELIGEELILVSDVLDGDVLDGSKLEVSPGTVRFQKSNSNGGVSVMMSESGSDHGISGNVVSCSTQIMEYNKEIVIPDKFSAMSGSLNISKACFYALCNRLIEIIDEILDMSSNMGIIFSIEAQKGIKDVMTSRQTRALSMIMDSL